MALKDPTHYFRYRKLQVNPKPRQHLMTRENLLLRRHRLQKIRVLLYCFSLVFELKQSHPRYLIVVRGEKSFQPNDAPWNQNETNGLGLS